MKRGEGAYQGPFPSQQTVDSSEQELSAELLHQPDAEWERMSVVKRWSEKVPFCPVRVVLGDLCPHSVVYIHGLSVGMAYGETEC